MIAPDEEAERPSRARSLKLLGAAAVFISIPFIVPHLPSRDPRSGLAEKFGLGTRERGDVAFDLLKINHGLAEAEALPPGPIRIGADDRLAMRYDGAGYAFYRVLEIRPGGELLALIPDALDAGQPNGALAEPRGGLLPLPSLGPGRVVLYTMFSAVPIKLDRLRADAAELGERDPEKLGRALQRLPGRAFVQVIEVAAHTATTAAWRPGGGSDR